ncbi:hypothetical protein ACSMXN_08370 [Jatrophihabitans sp. DSM 45814]
MPTVPRDMSDLHLAPVVLAVDARIDALGQLDADALTIAVEDTSDDPIKYLSFREEALITAIQQSIECHGWALAWDPRGLRMTHGERSLVLGVPPSFMAYLAADQLFLNASRRII